MTIMHVTRRPIKPTRHTIKPFSAFAAGIEPVCSVRPSIDGSGLSKLEVFRMWGVVNKVKSIYARDMPEADLVELDRVGRAAAKDELRRLLKDRPVAQDAPAPAAVGARSAADDLAAAAAGFAQVEFAPEWPERRPLHTDLDEIHWSAYGHLPVSRWAALPPIAGGAPSRPPFVRFEDRVVDAAYAERCFEHGDDLVRGSDYLSHPE